MDQFNATQQNDRRKSGWETSYSSTTTAEAEKRPGLRVKNTKATSYSNMSIGDVEKRLGFFLGSLNDKAISVEDMLVKFAHTAKAGPDDTLKTKEKVYQHLLEHIENERYPGEEGSEFKEANVHDLVHYAIGPILTDFRRRAGRDVRLRREKRIFSSDSTTGGYEDFVIMDEVSPMEENFVLVVEAKKTSLGRAVGQCLLAVKDMRDTNGGGKVYGFITTGEDWRMVVYDGSRFEMTEKFTILFQTMGKQRERWMRDYSALVDCMNVALSNGGIIGGKYPAEFFHDDLHVVTDFLLREYYWHGGPLECSESLDKKAIYRCAVFCIMI